jgi:hypothetical protein
LIALFKKFDRIDFLRAGFNAHSGEDGVRSCADVEHNLAPYRSINGDAITEIPTVIMGHGIVNQIIINEVFCDRWPEFDLVGSPRPRGILSDGG